MTLEIALVFAITVIVLFLFAAELFRVDQIALSVPVVLLAVGLIDPGEAVAGLSHPGTVTVAAMLALSVGLTKTGAITALTRLVRAIPAGGHGFQLFLLCIVAAAVSPFLNNTAVVVVFLPIFLAVAKQAGEPASRYLIPLSFSAILGGTISLIGTSTNLIVWGMVRSRGLEDLHIFSIAPLGVIYCAVGVAYLFTAGRWLLPHRPGEADLSSRYGLRSFVTELEVKPDSPVVGKRIGDLDWETKHKVSVLGIHKGEKAVLVPRSWRLRPGDAIYAQGDTDDLLALAKKAGLANLVERRQPAAEVGTANPLVELLVAPDAPLAGRTLREHRFQERHGAIVLAVQHHGVTVRERLDRLRLRAGDLLLVHGPPEALESLADSPDFIPLSEVRPAVGPRPHALVAVAIMAAVVVAAASGLVPILVAAMTGVVAMIFTGCLRIEEVYAELDWMVVFMLAGMIPLGIAMESSGAAKWLADVFAASIGRLGPTAVIAAFYLITAIATEVMSNNAAAIVLTPIALTTAADLQINPYALAVAVMFGASASFVTPIGYQTNAMIYGPGGYRYLDFVKVGLPLNLLLLVVATLLIPLLWPT